MPKFFLPLMSTNWVSFLRSASLFLIAASLHYRHLDLTLLSSPPIALMIMKVRFQTTLNIKKKMQLKPKLYLSSALGTKFVNQSRWTTIAMTQ